MKQISFRMLFECWYHPLQRIALFFSSVKSALVLKFHQSAHIFALDSENKSKRRNTMTRIAASLKWCAENTFIGQSLLKYTQRNNRMQSTVTANTFAIAVLQWTLSKDIRIMANFFDPIKESFTTKFPWRSWLQYFSASSIKCEFWELLGHSDTTILMIYVCKPNQFFECQLQYLKRTLKVISEKLKRPSTWHTLVSIYLLQVQARNRDKYRT